MSFNSPNVFPRRKDAPNPGSVLLAGGLPREALPLLEQAVASNGHSYKLLSDLGVCYRQLERFDDSREMFRRALELSPSHPTILLNLSNLEEDLGNFQASLDMRWRARFAKADDTCIAWSLALSLLRAGRWREAWPHWEFARYDKAWSTLGKWPVWDGAPLSKGKLLIQCEGGYGDTFCFMRYLRGLDFPVGLLTWSPQADLLRGHPWIDEIFGLNDGEHLLAGYAAQTSMLSLPAMLNVEGPEVIEPYIHAEPLKMAPTSKRRIGLCWKAEESGTVRRYRTIPDEIAGLFRSVDAEWHSLQYQERFPWMTDSTPSSWIEDAKLIAALDRIVTVDTAVAHLAGAMGKPTWLMVPLNSFWVWGTESERTPWYPSMRIFRNRHPSDWTELVERVAEELRGEAA